MGAKSQERKRRKRIAIENSKRKALRDGTSAEDWYLTIAVRKTCCAKPRCRRIIRVGDQFIYRRTPRESLCPLCAEAAGIVPRISRAWEIARRRGRIPR
jgi:hypothetical protein